MVLYINSQLMKALVKLAMASVGQAISEWLEISRGVKNNYLTRTKMY